MANSRWSKNLVKGLISCLQNLSLKKKSHIFIDNSTLDTTTLSQNVVHQSPSDAVPHPRRTETAVPLRKRHEVRKCSSLHTVSWFKTCENAKKVWWCIERGPFMATYPQWMRSQLKDTSSWSTKYLATERTGNQLQGKRHGLLWTVYVHIHDVLVEFVDL